MKEMRRVMVVCENTNSCGGLVHTAAGMVHGAGAQLFVLAVIDNPFGVRGLSFPRPSLKKDFEALVEKTGKDLQALISRERRPGTAAHALIREGKPVDQIETAVRDHQIDLLIVPAHEQTRLESLLAGGHNRTLLRRMPCSVMFVKSEPAAVPDEQEQGDEQEAAA